MTVQYIGETTPLALTKGKLYEVLSIEGGDPGWYRIIDDLQLVYIQQIKEMSFRFVQL